MATYKCIIRQNITLWFFIVLQEENEHIKTRYYFSCCRNQIQDTWCSKQYTTDSPYHMNNVYYMIMYSIYMDMYNIYICPGKCIL